MAELRDHVTQALRNMQDAGQIEGMPVEPPGGFSKNARAAEIVGLRRTDWTYINGPCEMGYHCPVCRYPQMVNGHYDERLFWSEYESFIWCSVCNRDYPSCLCLPDTPVRAIEVFLASAADAVSRGNEAMKHERDHWRDIAGRAARVALAFYDLYGCWLQVPRGTTLWYMQMGKAGYEAHETLLREAQEHGYPTGAPNA